MNYTVDTVDKRASEDCFCYDYLQAILYDL